MSETGGGDLRHIMNTRCDFRPFVEDPRHKRDWYGDRCEATTLLKEYLTPEGERETLCPFHHVVRMAMHLECDVCGNEVYSNEEDALAEADAAYGGPPGEANASAEEFARSLCDHCQYVMDKDC